MSVHIGTPVSAGSDDAAKEVPSGGPACFLECPSRTQVAESVGAHAKTKFASPESVSSREATVRMEWRIHKFKAETEKLCKGLEEVA